MPRHSAVSTIWKVFSLQRALLISSYIWRLMRRMSVSKYSSSLDCGSYGFLGQRNGYVGSEEVVDDIVASSLKVLLRNWAG